MPTFPGIGLSDGAGDGITTPAIGFSRACADDVEVESARVDFYFLSGHLQGGSVFDDYVCVQGAREHLSRRLQRH